MSEGSYVAAALKSIKLAAGDPAIDALIDAGLLLGESDYWSSVDGKLEVLRDYPEYGTRYAILVYVDTVPLVVLEATYVGRELRIPEFVPDSWQKELASYAYLVNK